MCVLLCFVLGLASASVTHIPPALLDRHWGQSCDCPSASDSIMENMGKHSALMH